MKTIRLGDVCSKIGSGATPRGGSEVYLDSGIALIRSQNIYNEGFRRDGLAFISREHADELENVVVEEGDVLLNITGDSVARACQVCKDVLPARVNQHVAIIRPDASVLDPHFLRYCLVSPSMQQRLFALAGAGATRDALTKAMIESLEITAPGVEGQRSIAKMLGALDDKIELNWRMDETLEAITRTIFKSTFGAFDPNWTIGKVSDCCERVENGGTPSRSEPRYWEQADVPWLTSGEVRQKIVIEAENSISREGLENSSAKLWPVGTTVVALYGATAGQTTFLAKEMCANQACCGLIPKHTFGLYIYLFLSNAVETLETMARGSAQQNLSQQLIAEFPVVVPTTEVLSTFTETCQPLFQKWILNLQECRTLSALRDALLPKLMSGELRIKDAERIVEAHV